MGILSFLPVSPNSGAYFRNSIFLNYIIINST